MAELVETYADFPLGGTDASVIALAERYKTDRVSRSTEDISPLYDRCTHRDFACFPSGMVVSL